MMNCERCGGTTKILKGQTWQYTESGLDNVYLRNVDVCACSACDAKSPRLPRINDLHAAIGRAIALQKIPLSGNEARYLRKHLGLQAKEWAVLLRIPPETLSRWENGKQVIGPQSDSLIRAFYFLKLAETGQPIPDHAVEEMAAIVAGSSETLSVLINVDNPNVYSYQSAELLAA